jgi:MYXO-CTERM domain-containing protein
MQRLTLFFGAARSARRYTLDARRGLLLTAGCLLGLLCRLTQAAPTSALDFGVYGGGPVTLETYSAVNGDVYSGGDLTLEFGYGIQRPGLTLGDAYTAGDLNMGISGDVVGNVYANGAVNLAGGEVHGTLYAAPGTVAPTLAIPQPAAFSHGPNDLIIGGGNALPPGAYRDVTITGSSLNLTAGDYYFRSLTTTSSTTFNFDLTNGPINLYVTDDISLATYQKYTINGDAVDGNLIREQRALASQILIEAHGDIVNNSRSLSGFFGTWFAPYGSITLDSADSYGALIARDGIKAQTYLVHVPSDELRARQLIPAIYPLPGDTDGDDDVDDADLGTAFANYTGPMAFGVGGKTRAHGDTDADSDIDDADLGVAFAGYTGPLTPASVPEPSALALAGLGGLALVRRRRAVA